MADRRLSLRRMMAKPAFRWFLLAYLIVAILGVAITFISEYSVERDFLEYRLEMRQVQLSERFDVQEIRIESIESTLESLELAETNLDETRQALKAISEFETQSVVARLSRVEDVAGSVGKELEHVKAILNPTNPEDVLTVLRVGDKLELLGREIEVLNADFIALRQDLVNRIEINHERALGRVDSITDTIGWIALLLVPVMLRVLRDFLPGRRQSDGSEET
ncbi:MAG: hypothetical protein F4222_12715 [Gammaproteobacteria bacterium]|nr:hypothetical protein [Gammaproteobacteria bacterium]MYF59907.1 hypothetical protein [Gammaproteobacteria bacterium]